MTLPRRGLYAILDAGRVPAERRVEAARAAIAGGAVMLQYRDKTGDAAARRRGAEALQECADDAGIPLLINDDVALAAEIDAGVHLGQADDAPEAAREKLGGDAIIGVTCHADPNLARAAVTAGADYVSFGRFFHSATKPGAPGATPEVLTAAKRAVDVPIVAIGGVNADNGAALLAAGADLLAAAGAVFGADDIRAAACRIADLFANESKEGVRPLQRYS